ncbi:hypothetical protein BD779DRAFT_1479695 [Infundibulicybe gibba]|nr:hypothetical protein BD779DRAFT_1479695 [Infundibulicybe gibba]
MGDQWGTTSSREGTGVIVRGRALGAGRMVRGENENRRDVAMRQFERKFLRPSVLSSRLTVTRNDGGGDTMPLVVCVKCLHLFIYTQRTTSGDDNSETATTEGDTGVSTTGDDDTAVHGRQQQDGGHLKGRHRGMAMGNDDSSETATAGDDIETATMADNSKMATTGDDSKTAGVGGDGKHGG